jgi:Metallopeptidase toxin 4
VGILFTGGILSVEAVLVKLGEAFRAIAGIVTGTVKGLYKAGQKTLTGFIEGLNFLIEFLKKGTDEIIRLIDDIFAKLRQAADDLIKKYVDDIPNLSESELDWMASRKIGNLGGKVLKASQIRKLRGILNEKGILLIVEGDLKSVTKLFKPIIVDGIYFDNVNNLFNYMRSKTPPYVGGFDPFNKQFILPKRILETGKLEFATTEIIAFHEMAHVKHFEEIGEVYLKLSELEKEMYVWNQILANKERWTKAELIDALDYINRIRIKPKYGKLELIKLK